MGETETTTLIEDIEAAAQALRYQIQLMGASREISLALTNLEQSVMWADKAFKNLQNPKND